MYLLALHRSSRVVTVRSVRWTAACAKYHTHIALENGLFQLLSPTACGFNPVLPVRTDFARSSNPRSFSFAIARSKVEAITSAARA